MQINPLFFLISHRAVTASNQVGALLCRLKVSNVEKLRLFFVAFVLSQLYGKELMSLKSSILQDLAHSFLVKCLSLPRSFPKIICFALLGVPPLNWQQARMFARFIQRIFEGEGKLHPAASCFLWDRLLCHEFLFCWFSEFSFLFEGAIPVDEVVDLNPLLLSVDRLDAILRVENNSLLSGLRQSASFFFLEIFPSGVASPNFRRTLGSLDYEDARLFVLFLGNSWRWSVFRTPRRACFFCSLSLSSPHFFQCPSFPCPMAIANFSWPEWVALCRRGEWIVAMTTLRNLLILWGRETGALSDSVSEWLG